MIAVYHLILGLITLFAILHLPDVKILLKTLISEAKKDSCGEPLKTVINYVFMIGGSCCLWVIFWPIFVITWTLSQFIKKEEGEIEAAKV